MNKREFEEFLSRFTDEVRREFKDRAGYPAPRWAGRGFVSWALFLGSPEQVSKLKLDVEEAQFMAACANFLFQRSGVSLDIRTVNLFREVGELWYLERCKRVLKQAA